MELNLGPLTIEQIFCPPSKTSQSPLLFFYLSYLWQLFRSWATFLSSFYTLSLIHSYMRFYFPIFSQKGRFPCQWVRKVLVIPVSGEPFSLSSGKYSQKGLCHSWHYVNAMWINNQNEKFFNRSWALWGTLIDPKMCPFSGFSAVALKVSLLFAKFLFSVRKGYFLQWITAYFLPRTEHVSRLLIMWLIFTTRILDNHRTFFRHYLAPG